jgi:hypothetical protein
MMPFMAMATNKKSKDKARNDDAGGSKQRRASPPDLAEEDTDEPDRATPPLAEVDAEALEFIAAIERFKKQHSRPFPSWSEVLLVLRQLGYRRS